MTEEIDKLQEVIALYTSIIPDSIEKEFKKKLSKEGPESAENYFFTNIKPITEAYIKEINSPHIDGEEEVWSGEETEGFIFKKTIRTFSLTNKRIIIKSEKETVYLGLAICEPVVCSTQRQSSGCSTRSKYNSVSCNTSRTFGDLSLMMQGKEIARIPNIQDPHGVKRLITTIKKQTKV